MVLIPIREMCRQPIPSVGCSPCMISLVNPLSSLRESCRRNKRSRELAGLDSAAARASRPTPPHLTSVQAEQILAQACENESQNAKRMRLGLEPISQPLQQPVGSPQVR